MAKVTGSVLLEHVQRFVREVYADRLHQAGFSSYKNEDIHWYRLIDGQVVQSVYFIANYMALPAMLEIRYGSHPLFIPPIFQRSPYMRGEPGYELMYTAIPEITPSSMPRGIQRSQIHGLTNIIYRIPDAVVHCPADMHTTHAILEKVLSVLDAIHTPEDCYKAHKNWRQGQIENGSWLTMSPYFVEEALCWEDSPLYPFCMEYIEGKISWLEGAKNLRKTDKEELTHLLTLRDVFINGTREQYLQTLCDRAGKNRRMLDKVITL